jgi:exonuclease III
LEEGSRIDFIFVSDEVKVKEIVTCNDTFEGNTYSSDHHPVVSALVI